MIKRTITFPSLPGLKLDNTEGQVQIIVDSDDLFFNDSLDFWDGQYGKQIYTTYTFNTPGGAKIVLDSDMAKDDSVLYVITETVELVEGRLYLVAEKRRSNEKWLALCSYNLKLDELVLEPIRGGGYPPFEESSKHNYTFYKEFDLDLKEYL